MRRRASSVSAKRALRTPGPPSSASTHRPLSSASVHSEARGAQAVAFAAEVDLNVIGNAQGELLEVQGTAEKRPFTPQQLHEMVALAQKGIQDLHRAQTAALAEALAQDAK